MKQLLIVVLAIALLCGGVYWFFFRDSSTAVHQTVSMTASDGVTLAATYYPGSDTRGVILVPGYGEARTVTEPFAEVLQASGFSVLAVDLRGQGENGNGALTFATADWQKVPGDIEMAVQFLLAQSGIMHIGVVGGGLGANAAIIHAATFNDVKALVTLSPTLNDRGLQPIDAFKTYDGPLYVMDQYVDPDDDKYHGHSVDPVIVEQAGDLFFAATTEDKDWFQVKEGGRGWTLVKPDSDVEKNMITFFTTKL